MRSWLGGEAGGAGLAGMTGSTISVVGSAEVAAVAGVSATGVFGPDVSQLHWAVSAIGGSTLWFTGPFVEVSGDGSAPVPLGFGARPASASPVTAARVWAGS